MANEKYFKPKDRGFLAEGMGYLLGNQALHKDLRAFLEPLATSPFKKVAAKARWVLKELENRA